MANTTKRTKKTKTTVEALLNTASNIFTFSFKRHKGQVFNLNENTIFSIPEFYACVRVLAQSIASLPINVYNVSDKSKLTIEDDELIYLLKYAPNPQQSIYEFMHTMIVQMFRYGQFFAYIQRDALLNKILSIIPIDNKMIDLVINDQTGEFGYIVKLNNGEQVLLPYEDVLSIKDFIDGGLLNNPVWKTQYETLYNVKVVQNFANDYFEDALNPSGVISSGNTISADQWQKFKDNFHSFVQNSGDANFLVLPQGLEFKEWNLDVSKSQMLELRKFNRTIIAGMFRVPPSFIGDLSNSTYSNEEQSSLNFTKFTLTPIVRNIEQKFNITLFSKLQLKKKYLELDMAMLERGDLASRYSAYSTAINAGFLRPNEARAKENLPNDEFGDVLLINGALQPLETARQKTEKTKLENEQLQQEIDTSSNLE